MPQLMRGARKPLDVINAALEAIQRQRTIGHRHAVGNPHFAMDQFEKIGSEVEQIREQLRELELLLERHSPEYEKRLAELERWREEIEGRVVPLRRAVGE